MAHKKGAGSSDNGRDSKSKRLGVKLFGGQHAVAGNIIIRQRGTSFHAGENVYMGRDHTLHAAIDGVVVFKRSFKDRRFVSIIPVQEVPETPAKSIKNRSNFKNEIAAMPAEKPAPAKKVSKAVAEEVAELAEAVAAPVVAAPVEIEASAAEVVVETEAPVEVAEAESAPVAAFESAASVEIEASAAEVAVETEAPVEVAEAESAPVASFEPAEPVEIEASAAEVAVEIDAPAEKKAAAPKKDKGPKLDDLKIIEGIGPKIETLLKEGGVTTWAELAAASEERLKEILAAAGPRYQIHDPSTWPAQSKFAAEGKWDELKEYQDVLIGGRDKSE